MTDLPQLETLLVDAARRRQRTRSMRRRALRALVVVAIVALAIVVVPWVGREAPDRELPANTPTPTPSPAVTGAPTRRAADFYSVLKRPARPEDAARGLAGSRKLVSQGHAAAWLVPRKGAVCLILGFHGEVSACRHNLADVRYPLVVALPGRPDLGEPQRVIAAVFPDSAKNISVVPPISTTRAGNTLLITEGDDARQLRWQASSTAPPSALTLPPGRDGFVLHAREESPASLPAETP